MFNKNSSRLSTDITFIAQDCEITGTLTIKGDARIDGQVEGGIKAGGELTIGSGAKVKANLEGKAVSIAGEVRGDVKAFENLELAASARLYGDIYTKQLKIEQGARFVGSSHLLEDAGTTPDSAGSHSSRLRQDKDKDKDKRRLSEA